MKKTRLLLILILITVLIVPCRLTSFAKPSRFVDDAKLVDASDAKNLTEKLDNVSNKRKMDIVVVTIDSLKGQNAIGFADDYYDNFGYGMGQSYDGILLLMSKQDRQWAISTSGYAIKVFTDAGLEYMEKEISKYLRRNEYAQAFSRFAELSDEFIEKASTGDAYDRHNLPKSALGLQWIVIAILGGLVIGLIATSPMRSALKSVAKQKAATNYITQGSMNVYESKDLFLYTTITKSPKPQGASSKGSTERTSSSGKKHGGKSGKL